MEIIPAIDIKDGKCVRLIQGDYNKVKVYFKDPIEAALKWKDSGAKILHIVDLDGAKSGKMVNFEIIKKIKNITNLQIEVGGGIRDKDTIKNLLSEGIEYVIIGTKLIENIEFLSEVFEFRSSILISVDIYNNKIKKSGWLKETDIKIMDFLKILLENGFNNIIVTDITRDGTLEGLNIELFKNIIEKFPELHLTIAGGVASMNDINIIKKINSPNIRGIIVGKALYEGKINLKEAIENVKMFYV